jgi:hypothetical protein
LHTLSRARAAAAKGRVCRRWGNTTLELGCPPRQCGMRLPITGVKALRMRRSSWHGSGSFRCTHAGCALFGWWTRSHSLRRRQADQTSSAMHYSLHLIFLGRPVPSCTRLMSRELGCADASLAGRDRDVAENKYSGGVRSIGTSSRVPVLFFRRSHTICDRYAKQRGRTLCVQTALGCRRRVY